MSTMLPCSGPAETIVTNTIFAAAFAAIGVRVHTFRNHDMGTGDEGARFMLADASETNPALKTCVLHWGLIKGTLAKADPTHPLLDGIRALRNRAALLRWIHRAEPHRLVIEDMRTRYVTGADQALLKAEVAVDDLNLTAALGALGWPVAKFTGLAPRHVFHLPRQSLPLRTATFDLVTTLTKLRNGELARLEPDHPIHVMLRALAEYDNIQRLLKAEPVMLHFKDKWYHSNRSAVIRPDANGKAFDNAKRFFAQRG